MRESQVSAKVIADSISPNGTRITTFELEYPRFIHSEFLTHRMFSRNSASSRAIPISKMMEQVKNDPAMPMHWGVNQAGMQAKESITGWKRNVAGMLWKSAAAAAVTSASTLEEFGLHKQIVNRLLEPFQRMKTVITSTEWNNYFHLRDHPDAQPEIEELAKAMKIAMDESTPQKLEIGEWHLPYVEWNTDADGQYFLHEDITSLEEALKVSASCCAQVSYRLLDESVEKAIKIYDQLVAGKPVHASPFEHQAKVMVQPCVDNTYGMDLDSYYIDIGTTHMDMSGVFWSGNFKGFIQHRQLIKDHVVEG